MVLARCTPACHGSQPQISPLSQRAHFFASRCINSKDRGGRELAPKQVQTLFGRSLHRDDARLALVRQGGNREELEQATRAHAAGRVPKERDDIDRKCAQRHGDLSACVSVSVDDPHSVRGS